MLPGFFLNSFRFLAVSCSNHAGFFQFPTWYSYLTVKANAATGTCDIVFARQGDVLGGLVLVALAILDMALRLAGLVAIGFVIYGGIQYIISRGQPDKTAQAQSTIINALVGLGLAFIATGLVSFLGSKLG